MLNHKTDEDNKKALWHFYLLMCYPLHRTVVILEQQQSRFKLQDPGPWPLAEKGVK